MGIEWSIRELMLSAEVQGPKNGSLELGHNAVDRDGWIPEIFYKQKWQELLIKWVLSGEAERKREN